MRVLFIFLIGAVTAITSEAQIQIHQQLNSSYESYRASEITHRRFKYEDVKNQLDRISDKLSVSKVGESVGGKNINLVKYGEGPVSVLLWSQMHGNEPTATMALMDIFNFLINENHEFSDFRDLLRNKLTVYFIPMLNPDGADLFQRRNLYGFDINRDALRLQSPEGRTLKKVRDSLDADWGFNLHDQNRYTSAGPTENTATLSFLAPAYNFEKDINEKRGDAMQLIGHMCSILDNYIPDQIGKYPDDFEPRAFGDNIQKWGTRTILIESGGYRGDREKQEIRKFNYLAILSALQSIAELSYEDYSIETYENLPFNRGGRLHELILRNAKLELKDDEYIADIAFRSNEIENEDHSDYYLRSRIADIGDLSTSDAYQEIDVEGYQISAGRFYEKELKDFNELKSLDLNALLKEGYTDYVIENLNEEDFYQNLPIAVRIHANLPDNLPTVQLGENPSLILDGPEIDYAVINGEVVKIQ